MYKKKPIFLTDGLGGIYKIEKLIRAAILKNLETGESITSEIIGSTITGFALIEMPTVKEVPINLPKTASSVQKNYKPRKIKNKKSQYYGVSLCNKTGNKKNTYLGTFETEIEASKRIDAELEKRGLPKRNFP